ncbi:recombinase family protein [Clostridium botulinum]|uniref:recombinase family protein n=1 Tax=Clostridium botulinum TaxID=1491 RepID=UPI0007745DD5|nr:recombinase family protein [Clostridium botulinum]NFE93684.1 recombinase family protein [Clostridium botulinum]NFL38434.1 recombinase family protein [Clostridium botulinum]NFL65874.1 recombinase family protein [Clostridium botulinum]NFN08271.1 recombinase family protein [Clostridium botulinum]NFN24416.1 recombinase family protein [Clostridium botulinum]
MKIAIYSRKSIFTGKGESIENQIELCKEYCTLHYKDENIEYTIYEDEGFSGKNLNRPKFKELINEIKKNKYDVLICYRLDRISRNVADFSSTLELLQKYNTNFVSIKEQFDTSTPMGRAMIYIASVFAQLERETIAERVRDNMLQLAKMGKWSGGQLPLGFKSEKITYINDEMKEKSYVKLVPIDEELKTIKFIYNNYLLKGSILNVVKELNELGYKTKTGTNFELTGVKRILKSSLYVKSNELTHEYLKSKDYNVYGKANGNGYLTYNKKTDINNIIIAVAAHKGIISAIDWITAQKKLDINREKAKIISNRSGTGKNDSLFSGLLKCGKCGANMVIKYNSKNKNGENYIYYVCSNKHRKFNENKCYFPNFRTDIVDEKIINQLKIYNRNIIIKIYNDKLDDLTENSNKEIINELKKQINDKKTQINNIVMELSLASEESVKTILRDNMNSVAKEIEKLNLKINNTNLIETDINKTILEIKHLIKSFKDFDEMFDSTNDIDIKRNLLKNIIQEIKIDLLNKNFDVKFFNIDSMQLDSASKPLDCNLYPSKRRRNCRFT